MSDGAPSTLVAIDRAGKYVLGALLGRGGMAEVYRGWITGANGFNREVAIKVVIGEHSQDENFVARFLNEARLASLLHHPNVVAVLDCDRDATGRLFQVLEFVEGRDLDKLASLGALPPPVVYYIMQGVLRGLDHAHSAINPTTRRPLGIVHRDCTPSNVLLSYAGTVKLSDFGVAKAVFATNATAAGSLVGKPSYMSPEQLKGLELDGRTDLFSVGVMFWELFAGYRPFEGTTVQEVLSKVLEYSHGYTRIPPIEHVNPQVPPAIAGLINALLAADREQRPRTAAEALAFLNPWVPTDGAEQLARLLAERAPRAETATSAPSTVQGKGRGLAPNHTPTALGQVAQAATGFPGAPAPAVARRSPWPLAAVGAGLAIGGIALAIGLSSGGESRSAAPPASSAAPGVDAASTVAVTPPVDASVPPDAAPAVADAPPDASASVDAGVSTHTTHRGRPEGKRTGKPDAGPAGVYEVNLGGSSKP